MRLNLPWKVIRMSIESSKAEIHRLVEKFKNNHAAFINPKYNETQLRREFLDPFFEALGWDVSNKAGVAEQYKEVIHEDSIRVSSSNKAPDYCFRVGSERKFFVEAKKPAVNIKNDAECAFQIRRYGWSANLGLSLLTNFREFAIYDCRIKPTPKDGSSVARVLYVDLSTNPDGLEQIIEVFSRDAVWKGSFDNYTKTAKGKRGTSTVDNAFLAELEEWRSLLAKNLYKANPKLNQRELNYSVQRTLDRILFLRISEDRGLENIGQLRDLIGKKNIYSDLCKLFLAADEKYNSGLFHFHKENDRPEPPDELCLRLTLEDKVLKEIIGNLYYPHSPYEFSVLPIEILGQVYEKFLGKYLKVSAGGKVTVEEKPIVKKAGGVFYTPSYIVNEIINESLKPLLKDKTPEQVEKVKIIDPACGSGSFLISAYDCMLNWHLDYYLSNAKKGYADRIHQNKNGRWVLNSSEKKRIMLSSIYGVDIDAQAVETTKLSLLLKVLEDETNEAISKQMSLFKERALPDLGFNIKCGNSLVSDRIFHEYNSKQLDDETVFKINPFDWTKEFPAVFNRPNPGFDTVIGNPPYVRVQLLSEVIPLQGDYLPKVYSSAQKGNYDIYVTFVEKGLEILRKSGTLGFILPHKFMNAEYGEPLRELLSSRSCVNKIVHFGDQQVFDQATTYTCLLHLTNKKVVDFVFEKVVSLDDWRNTRISKKGLMKSSDLDAGPWVLSSNTEKCLLERLAKKYDTLESLTNRIFQGLKTGGDKTYIVEKISAKKDFMVIRSKQTGKEHEVEKNLFLNLAKGGNSRNYILVPDEKMILFPYRDDGQGAKIIPEKEMSRSYPLTYKYLKECRTALAEREDGAFENNNLPWYQYSRTQALDVITKYEIFTPDIAPKSEFSIDPSRKTFFTGGVSGGYGLIPKTREDSLFLLGILNSKVVDWFIRQTSTQMRGGYYSFESKYIKHIPIPKASKKDKDAIAQLVQEVVAIGMNLEKVELGSEIKLLNKKRQSIHEKIEALVFSLYELSKEEIETIQLEYAAIKVS